MRTSRPIALAALLLASPLAAELPAPDHVLFGTATRDGLLVESGVVEVRLGTAPRADHDLPDRHGAGVRRALRPAPADGRPRAAQAGHGTRRRRGADLSRRRPRGLHRGRATPARRRRSTSTPRSTTTPSSGSSTSIPRPPGGAPDARLVEGGPGSTQILNLVVRLSRAVTYDVVVDWATANGTATGGAASPADYLSGFGHGDDPGGRGRGLPRPLDLRRRPRGNRRDLHPDALEPAYARRTLALRRREWRCAPRRRGDRDRRDRSRRQPPGGAGRRRADSRGRRRRAGLRAPADHRRPRGAERRPGSARDRLRDGRWHGGGRQRLRGDERHGDDRHGGRLPRGRQAVRRGARRDLPGQRRRGSGDLLPRPADAAGSGPGRLRDPRRRAESRRSRPTRPSSTTSRRSSRAPTAPAASADRSAGC